jgi:hypothetical protein
MRKMLISIRYTNNEVHMRKTRLDTCFVSYNGNIISFIKCRLVNFESTDKLIFNPGRVLDLGHKNIFI